ncbi:MAG: pyridoxal-phosphate dependent enzyme [Gemmatimonadota bacterium]|nr:pyridoxal-phosphate dependent enzyme [Gemmatimonadota bacterium]
MAHATHARFDTALDRLDSVAALPLVRAATPLEEMVRLRAALGDGGPRLLVKRDDAIPFGFGGNKVRKLQIVAAEALAAGADTLVTCGGVQSNHARATAATATRLGLGCVIVANGIRPPRLTGNALLDELLGAEVEYVTTRAERDAGMERAAERLRREGRVPCVIPLGASTPRGALAYARAVGEMLRQVPAPDAIVHACSSGGTQAGLLAGCALNGLSTRVIGVSADDPASNVADAVARIVSGMGPLLGLDGDELAAACPIEVDDSFVGEGYGLATEASREAQRLAARTEALFVDHTYTAKALAALIAYVRDGRLREGQTVLFWHTGGQVGLFA